MDNLNLEEKIWHLEKFNLFASLSKSDMAELSTKTTMKTLSAGQMIYLPFDEANSIYFLKEGKIKISKYSKDGKELIKCIHPVNPYFKVNS